MTATQEMTASVASPELVACASRLADVLEAMCEQQRTLLTLAEEHLRAVRLADAVAIAHLSQQRSMAVGQLEALERERSRCVGPWRAERVATVAAIASRVPGELGSRLSLVASELRKLIGEVQARHEQVKDVTRRVAEHLAGVTRSMVQARSVHGAYSRFGRAVPVAASPGTLDLRR